MKQQDDFDWHNEYTGKYVAQIDDMISDNWDFLVNNSYINDNKFILKDNLHPNWIEIYSQIIKHKENINSVFECGCGGCYHLYNIGKLMPDLEVNGCDISKDQLNEAAIHKLGIPIELVNKVKIYDFASEIVISKKYDFVFTQAVIMHISYDKALQFIKNMKDISNKYVMMIENQGEHDFPKLFKDSGILENFTLEYTSSNVESMLFTRR